MCYSGSMETQVLPHGTELEYWKDQTAYLWAEKACLEAEINWLEGENARLQAGNTAFVAQVQELEGQIEALKARVLKLTQQVYGRRSEQQSPKDKDSVGDHSQQSQSSGRRGQRVGAKGHGRRKYLNLPAREEIHDVPETKKLCPHCGLPYAPFSPGEETSEEIDWQVVVQRVVHRRLSYHKTCRGSGDYYRCPASQGNPQRTVHCRIHCPAYNRKVRSGPAPLPYRRSHAHGWSGSGSGHPGRGVPAGVFVAGPSVRRHPCPF